VQESKALRSVEKAAGGQQTTDDQERERERERDTHTHTHTHTHEAQQKQCRNGGFEPLAGNLPHTSKKEHNRNAAQARHTVFIFHVALLTEATSVFFN